MKKLDVIFMGTPKFSVNIVNEINKVHNVRLVVTQPDSYSHKLHKDVYSDVKNWAIEHNIEVFQPEKIKTDYDKILNTPCDIIVTAAYGQIVGEEVLNYPKYRCINVHGSILPKYRGGAPIQRAIMNGDKETGVTIMYMEKGMDSGDILRIEKIPILDSDNQETIFDKLSELGGSIINEVIDDLVNGKINPIKQNEALVTYAPTIKKEEERIDFNNKAEDIHNLIRGLNPNPGCFFMLDNMPVKVYNSIVSNSVCNSEVGTIIAINKKSFDISCKDGTVLSILELQLPGKNRVKASEFINGQGRKLISIGKELNK